MGPWDIRTNALTYTAFPQSAFHVMSVEHPVIGRTKRAVKMNILKLNGDYRERMGPDNNRTLVSIEFFHTIV